MNDYLVSLIIVSLDGRELLPACLDSVALEMTSDYEMILVDNGSTDDSGPFVISNYPWVRVIRSEQNLGFAGGSNFGAKHAKGKYLLFLTNDIVVTPKFLDELIRVLDADPLAGLVQSKLLMADNPNVIDSVGSYLTPTGILLHAEHGQSEKKHLGGPKEILGAAGASILIRREIFEQLGGFDGDYVTYFEDTDLSWRIWLLGYKVLLVPDSKVYHWGGVTTKKFPSQITVFHSFKNRICSLIKLLSGRDLLRILPIHLIICLSGSLAYLLRLKWRNSFAILEAIAWNLVNLRSTYEKRLEVSINSKVSRESLFPRLMRSMPASHFLKSSLGYLSEW